MRASWQEPLPCAYHEVDETLGSDSRILACLQRSDCTNRARVKIWQVAALISQNCEICQGFSYSAMHRFWPSPALLQCVFFKTAGRTRLLEHEFSKKPRKKNTVFAKNNICFSSLNSHSQFFIEFPSKITKRGTFNAGIFEQVMDTFPHPKRIRNRQRQFNESHHAKYTFS